MPVSLATARDPFRGLPAAPPLRVPQARVLAALVPGHHDDHPVDWPVISRAQLGVRAGYTAISGTVTRALNGIGTAGTKMGTPHLGLLALGYVEEVVLDVEGRPEVSYRATAAGVAAYRQHLAAVDAIAPVKDAARCANKRYRRGPA